MAHRTHLPDETALRKFLLGELPDAEIDAVAHFLDSNPQLADGLSALQASDPLLSALQSIPAQLSHDTPDLEGLITRIVSMVHQAAPPDTSHASEAGKVTSSVQPEVDEQHAETSSPDSLLAGILTPAEAPDEMGRFAEFRVLRELGRGGMGLVFEAEDPKLGRRVALKVMSATLAANPTAKKRFLLEARAAATVAHDHIVPIFQIGEDPRGLPFLVMPLLAGESLEDRLRTRQPLAVADVLTIGQQIADGLQAAHEAGLIHRDIKPSNIWLEREPGGLFKRVRILDFGLARSIRTTSENLTHSGAIMGTPAYMAPEQGRGLAVDQRADLFSLGSVLYQLATGRRAFTGPDTFAILTALATETPPPPLVLNPALPPALSELIARLLAKDPNERWPQTAAEVLKELARIAQHTAAGSGTLIAVIHNAHANPADAWSAVTETELHEPHTPAKPKRRRRALFTAGVLFLAFATLAAANGPTIIRVVSNEGELVVVVDDDNVEVVVKGTSVEILDPDGKRYLVSAGKDGEVEIREKGTDNVLVTEKFRVKRGGKSVVSVSNEKLAAARKKETVKPPATGAEPQLPAGDTPPAKDAFPGRLTFFNAYDTAVGADIYIGSWDGVDYAVDRGLYRLSTGKANANKSLFASLAPPARDMAFATRVRSENAVIQMAFRIQSDEEAGNWLLVQITPSGRWSLGRLDRVLQGGRYEEKLTILAASEADNPDLAGGKWINVAGRSVGERYEVWLNGQRVVEGVDNRMFLGKSIFRQGLQYCSYVHQDGPARVEIDYTAVWDLNKKPIDAMKEDDISSPPARNAFPGELLAYDIVDNPSTSVFDLKAPGASVKDGVYIREFPAGTTQKQWALLGRPTNDVALVLRARATDLDWTLMFGAWSTPGKSGYTMFRVFAGGGWSLDRVTFVQDKQKPEFMVPQPIETLDSSNNREEDKLSGRWLTLTLRSVGDDVDISVDGKPLARGRLRGDRSLNMKPITAAVTISCDSNPTSPGRFEVEHVAVWNLVRMPGGVQPREPQTVIDHDRQAAEHVLSIGGRVWIATGDSETEVLGVGKLPRTPFRIIAIDLTGNAKVDDATLEMLAVATDLKQLHLAGTRVGDRGLAHLGKLTKLERIEIPNTFVTDAGLIHLKNCKNLNWLSLNNTAIDGTGLLSLQELEKLSHVFIAYTKLDDAGLLKLTAFPALRVVHVEFSSVTEAGAKKLAAARPELSIEWGNRQRIVPFAVDRRAAEYVLSIGGVVRMQGLDKNIRKTDELPDEPFALEGVLLRGNQQVTDEGLSVFKGCRGLQTLDLVRTPITNAALAHFRECKDIRLLDLVGTHIDDDGIMNFAGCTQVVSLWLGGTRVTDKGIAIFKDCRHLNHFDVSGTKVTDAGLKHFSGCKNLVFLGFGETTITDTGLNYFKDCTHLNHLYVIKSGVTPEAIMEWSERLPGCKIVWGDGQVIEPREPKMP